jgi:hypothetical protein
MDGNCSGRSRAITCIFNLAQSKNRAIQSQSCSIPVEWGMSQDKNLFICASNLIEGCSEGLLQQMSLLAFPANVLSTSLLRMLATGSLCLWDVLFCRKAPYRTVHSAKRCLSIVSALKNRLNNLQHLAGSQASGEDCTEGYLHRRRYWSTCPPHNVPTVAIARPFLCSGRGNCRHNDCWVCKALT